VADLDAAVVEAEPKLDPQSPSVDELPPLLVDGKLTDLGRSVHVDLSFGTFVALADNPFLTKKERFDAGEREADQKIATNHPDALMSARESIRFRQLRHQVTLPTRASVPAVPLVARRVLGPARPGRRATASRSHSPPGRPSSDDEPEPPDVAEGAL
jgi:hypothetical protein